MPGVKSTLSCKPAGQRMHLGAHCLDIRRVAQVVNLKLFATQTVGDTYQTHLAVHLLKPPLGRGCLQVWFRTLVRYAHVKN
jgi:hypothetical protein